MRIAHPQADHRPPTPQGPLLSTRQRGPRHGSALLTWVDLNLLGDRVPLLCCPLLEPGDVLWVDRTPSKRKVRLSWGFLVRPIALKLDHGQVLGRLDVLGIKTPLLDVRLVLLQTVTKEFQYGEPGGKGLLGGSGR